MTLEAVGLRQVKTTKEAIRGHYEQTARWYDINAELVLAELWCLAALRRWLIRKSAGIVLEVAAGTGRNLHVYPRGCRVTAVDLSPAMLDRARRRGVGADFRVMDAEALEFPDGSFDTVVSTLSTCTFPDPARALREMARVCRHGGRVLLLEHGRSSLPWLGRLQDRTADWHARRQCCVWNRRPIELAAGAGLRVVERRSRFHGVFVALVAVPIFSDSVKPSSLLEAVKRGRS